MLLQPAQRVSVAQFVHLAQLVAGRRVEGPPEGHILRGCDVGSREVEGTHRNGIPHVKRKEGSAQPNALQKLEVGEAAICGHLHSSCESLGRHLPAYRQSRRLCSLVTHGGGEAYHMLARVVMPAHAEQRCIALANKARPGRRLHRMIAGRVWSRTAAAKHHVPIPQTLCSSM